MAVIACRRRSRAAETSVDLKVVQMSLAVGLTLASDLDLGKWVLRPSEAPQLHFLA